MEIISLVAAFSLLFVALIFSPLGLGGGVLYVPIIYYLLDWDIQDAVVASLSLVFMVALGSGLAHSKDGYADNKVANIGRITAIPAAILGTYISGYLILSVGEIGIKILAALIIAFVFERTIRRMMSGDGAGEEEISISTKTNQYRLGAAFAGTSAGMLGIGGGAILVTLNRSLLKMDANKAAGTSYLISTTIVPVALLSHIILDKNIGQMIETIGILPIIIIPSMAILSAFFGAKYAIKHIPKSAVTIVFLCAISLSLLRYIVDFVSYI